MSRVFRKVKYIRDRYPLPNLPLDTQTFFPEPSGEENLLHPPPAAEPPVNLEEIRAQADRILAEAEEERNAILKEARDDAERIRADAFQQGIAQGKEEGLKEGKELLAREIDRQRKEFADLARSIRIEKEKLLRDCEPEIVDLALDIARSVIREEIRTNRDVVVALVRDALNRLAKKENITVRVNAEDLELLSLHKPELLRSADLEDLRILADPRVERGGCIVDSAGGQVDGRIDVQIANVEKTLNNVKSEGKSERDD